MNYRRDGLNIAHVYATHAQTATPWEALRIASLALKAANHSGYAYDEETRNRWRLVAFVYLNRACELACTPVHVRPVETSNGLDYAWYSYRPVAQGLKRFLVSSYDGRSINWQYVYHPTEIEPVYLGLENDLTEDQARSKAMGW